jgi:putative phage-type endonuclease
MSPALAARIAFLEGRQGGIGSSDVAPILGISPWSTALDVYYEKITPVVDVAAQPMAAPLEWGIRKEPLIAGAIADHYGWTLRKVPPIQHADYPFLVSNVDRENQDGEPIEIKTAYQSEGWGDAETDAIPEYYWPQVQHQLACRASQSQFHAFSWVFVLIGSSDFRRYKVPYDPEFLPAVIDPLKLFWAHVEERIPPEADWTKPEATLRALRNVYPPEPSEIAILDDYAASLVAEYEAKGAEEKAAKERRDEIKAELVSILKTAGIGELPDGRRVEHKKMSRAGYVVAPTEFYQVNIRKGKKR